MNEELRDVFAMAALAGLLASKLVQVPGNNIELLTQLAYKLADGMIKAREQQ